MSDLLYFENANSWDDSIYCGIPTGHTYYIEECGKYLVELDNIKRITTNGVNDIYKNVSSTCNAWEDMCFNSLEVLRNKIKERNQKTIENYCNKISTIEDLIRFPVEYHLFGDNLLEEQAYKQMAMKLTNINFE